MEAKTIDEVVEAILFASGEPVAVSRIAAVLSVDESEILSSGKRIAEKLNEGGHGIRLLRLENTLQLASAPEYSDYIRLALESRKPPKLSQSALEVLAIIAYFQPVTRAYIEQVRGADSSYTVSSLVEKGLIEPCGTLDAPGRPTIFKTTGTFLRTFGISSLQELPALPEENKGNERLEMEKNIEILSHDAEEEYGNDDIEP